MKIFFIDEASDEFRDAVEYYNEQRQGLGFEFANEVKATLSRIGIYPVTWPELESGIRKCIIKRFPYALIYTIEDDLIIILAIMHMKRKPDYWKNRNNN